MKLFEIKWKIILCFDYTQQHYREVFDKVAERRRSAILFRCHFLKITRTDIGEIVNKEPYEILIKESCVEKNTNNTSEIGNINNKM